jgi:hypothetical protein
MGFDGLGNECDRAHGGRRAFDRDGPSDGPTVLGDERRRVGLGYFVEQGETRCLEVARGNRFGHGLFDRGH